uniref:GCK domain-containing protein n=4 Tax=Triticinae TaxID=1648030 RepID=A0A453MGK6_AEGTS
TKSTKSRARNSAMASVASEVDPADEPHIVVVGESSSAGGSREEAPPEAAAVEAVVETEPADGEEKGECGFCLYMKAGGCKEAFVSWEECVQAAEKEGSDMVERCFQATTNLKKCMDAHADYYAPVLQAERTVSDQAEAAIGAATADTNKNSEESAPSPDTDWVVVEQATSSTAAEGVKKEEAIVDKAQTLSLGN